MNANLFNNTLEMTKTEAKAAGKIGYNAEEEEIGSATYCGTQVVKGFFDSIPVEKM